MTRRQERESALALIYEMEFYAWSDTDERIEMSCEELELETDDHVCEVVYGVRDNLARIDEEIARHTVGWKSDRLGRISVAIMRQSVYEMLCRCDIPFSVSINEAVELAKKYDGDRAPKFINGVLNAVAEAAGLKTK